MSFHAGQWSAKTVYWEVKMISIEKLKDYANKLEFDMKDEEYFTLQSEFEVLLKQMDLIGNIEGLSEVEPMNFPFPLDNSYLREDEVDMEISRSDALMNTKDVLDDCVKVPKVVE